MCELLVFTKYIFQGRHSEIVGPLNVCKYVRWSTNCVTAITGCCIQTTRAYKIKIQFPNICIRVTGADAVISQTWIQQPKLSITHHTPASEQRVADPVTDTIIHNDVDQ